MAISYNTGATGGTSTSATVTVVIPAGVLVGDVMLMSLEVFTETATPPTIAFSGAGGNWTLITPTDASANPQVSSQSGIWSYGFAYYRVATAGDQGATLTITESGSAAGTTWLKVAIAAYTGASTTSPVDVAGGAQAAGTQTQTVTCPTLTTGVSGDWAVYLAPCGPTAGATINGPGTARQSILGADGIASVIRDSNGSVGNAGTSIGGGSFSATGASGNTWWEAFTVGLASPQVPSSIPPFTQKLPNFPISVVTSSGWRNAGHSK